MTLQGLIQICPKCNQKNRIQPELLHALPSCGRCKAPLPPITEPLALDDLTFEEVVGRARLPVLVDFWAPWCGPCRTFAPTFLDFARSHAGRVLACKVNVDEAERVAARMGIQSIPTLALFFGGRVVSRELGSVGKAALERMLDAVDASR